MTTLNEHHWGGYDRPSALADREMALGSLREALAAQRDRLLRQDAAATVAMSQADDRERFGNGDRKVPPLWSIDTLLNLLPLDRVSRSDVCYIQGSVVQFEPDGQFMVEDDSSVEAGAILCEIPGSWGVQHEIVRDHVQRNQRLFLRLMGRAFRNHDTSVTFHVQHCDIPGAERTTNLGGATLRLDRKETVWPSPSVAGRPADPEVGSPSEPPDPPDHVIEIQKIQLYAVDQHGNPAFIVMEHGEKTQSQESDLQCGGVVSADTARHLLTEHDQVLPRMDAERIRQLTPDQLIDPLKGRRENGDPRTEDCCAGGTCDHCAYDRLDPTPPPPAALGWRRLDRPVQDEYVAWMTRQMRDRLLIGEQRYGSHLCGFQDDPMRHLAEELLDAPFYAWEVERKHQSDMRVPDALLWAAWQRYVSHVYGMQPERSWFNHLWPLPTEADQEDFVQFVSAWTVLNPNLRERLAGLRGALHLPFLPDAQATRERDIGG